MSGLKIGGLAAGYGNKPILSAVDLDLGDGQTVALFGANGSGKSTLLRAISGLIPYEGVIAFRSTVLTGLPVESIAALGIAHVPQGRGTFIHFTTEQNLNLGGATLGGRRDIAAEIERVYELFPELSARRRQVAGTLSGGEQQMLAIGRALMMRPSLMLLDEPSAGLAPAVTHRLFDALGRLRATGMSFLLVEQHPRTVAGFADKASILENGRITTSVAADDPSLPTWLARSYSVGSRT